MMPVLLDHCTPQGIARYLTGHTVKAARKLGWAELSNGTLLQAAEDAGFDVMVTADQNIRYQQNLSGRKIALVVLTRSRWTLIKQMAAQIALAVHAATPGSYTEVAIFDPDGA
jgi:hypothetical protein